MPIIVVTSRTDTAAIQESLAAGASSFLVKPVVWSTFEHHVGFLMELVRKGRDARVAAHRMSAASRAKDAIIGGLFGDGAGNAREILEHVQELRRLVIDREAQRIFDVRFSLIEQECRNIIASADRALDTVRLLERLLLVNEQAIPLAEIVETVVQTAKGEAGRRGVTIHATLPAMPLQIKCERSAMELALMSLVENAIENAPAGSAVKIAVETHSDGMVSIDVSDRGKGMSQDRVVRCLAPLIAAETDIRDETPMGAGLLLAKALVEAHDGKLEIRSQIGDGTNAMLTLPADRTITHELAA